MHLTRLTAIILSVALLWGCTNMQTSAPKAKVIAHKDSIFGEVRIDNYFWLRDRENPEVIQYLKDENVYTEQVMKHTKPLQEKLYKEMVSRIKETDESVPYKKGDYLYYTKTEEGKQYEIYCRKKDAKDATEEILLDENLLAKGHDFFSIGVFEISPNQNLLAYSADTSGSESYTIYFKDLTTGEILKDEIPGTYYSMAWANDNKTIFYNIMDEAKRPYKLFRHELGQSTDQDELIYHEKDEKFFLSVGRSKSGRFIYLNLSSQITSELHYLDADKPQRKFKLFAERVNGIEYSVYHHKNDFYIRTNENALNFKLMKTSVAKPAKKYWKEVIPARKEVTLSSVELFSNYLAFFEMDKGIMKIRIQDLKDKSIYPVVFEESAYQLFPIDNYEMDLEKLRFVYSSLRTPRTVFDFDMQSKLQTELKKQEVLGGYNPTNYVTERIYAPTQDGAQIPISVLYKKGTKLDGAHPLYLYGYGSYGNNIQPRFSSARFSLVDRGFVYAIAHVRGSSTMGRQWYEDGKLLNKKNTFTDFIASAEYLAKQKYCSKDKITVVGGSAGGLLMGAVVNMRPDLFHTVVAHVPFVDVINTMLDASIPLTVIEYEEWGNPNIEKYYRYMKSYSPYDQVEAKAYPKMLITAGLNDPRVQYWEPAKWTAKLRALKTDNNTLLLKTNMGAGHMGASGRYDYLKEIAFEYAFILEQLGIKE